MTSNTNMNVIPTTTIACLYRPEWEADGKERFAVTAEALVYGRKELYKDIVLVDIVIKGSYNAVLAAITDPDGNNEIELIGVNEIAAEIVKRINNPALAKLYPQAEPMDDPRDAEIALDANLARMIRAKPPINLIDEPTHTS